MPTAEPRRSLQEAARLGREMYDRHVRPQLQPEDNDKFVAVNIETGEYELDAHDHTALKRLRSRSPVGEIWLGRVGHPTAHKMRSGR